MVSKIWSVANWLNPFSVLTSLRALGCLSLVWGGWFLIRLIPPIEEMPDLPVYSPKIIQLDAEPGIDWQSIRSLRLQSSSNSHGFSRETPQTLKSRRDLEAEKQKFPRFHFRITGILADSAKPQEATVHLTMGDGHSFWLRVGDSLPGRFSSWKIRSIQLGTVHIERDGLSDWIGVGQSKKLPGVSPKGQSAVEIQVQPDRPNESVSSSQ